MRKMFRLAAVTILSAFTLSAAADASETAAFLKIGVGARAVGMGGAYTAVANDASAMTWNPAGLGSVSRRELGVSDAELGNNTRLAFVGLAQPGKLGTFGVGLLRLTQGAIESRDASGRLDGSITAADTAVNLSYGAPISAGTRLGASIRFIQSQIAEVSAQSFAIDVGGMRELNGPGPGVPLVAAAIQNLGPGMRFLDETSQLPLTAALGLGYRLPAGLMLALDYRHHPYSHSSELAAGTEYAVLSSFVLRAGYAGRQATGRTLKTRDTFALNGVALGFGVRFHGNSVDYSASPFGEFGNVQRFSLSARF